MAIIQFEGRLTSDPEVKYGNDGKPRASFTVAENFRQQNRDTREWEDSGVTFHRVTVFGRQAESTRLAKGAVVTISGTQKSRAYTSNDGEAKTWTETTTNTVGYVDVPQRNTAPSPQGESFNPQQAPQSNGWPATAQPGQGQQQANGYDDPPF